MAGTPANTVARSFPIRSAGSGAIGPRSNSENFPHVRKFSSDPPRLALPAVQRGCAPVFPAYVRGRRLQADARSRSAAECPAWDGDANAGVEIENISEHDARLVHLRAGTVQAGRQCRVDG